MNGISAIHSRIAAIDARFNRPEPVAAPTADAPAAISVAPVVRDPSTLALDIGRGADPFLATYVAALEAPDAMTPALRLAPGAYGSLEAPPELTPFGNGRVPPAALVAIGDGHQLHAPAAQAFSRMEADARRDGVDLAIISSYRDLPTQQRLAAEKGLYSEGGLAATPGTSNHGWGLSVDLRLDDRAQAWLRANGPRYGFVEDVPREPWHWTYRPA